MVCGVLLSVSIWCRLFCLVVMLLFFSLLCSSLLRWWLFLLLLMMSGLYGVVCFLCIVLMICEVLLLLFLYMVMLLCWVWGKWFRLSVRYMLFWWVSCSFWFCLSVVFWLWVIFIC